ncbi:MAG TPA: DEAD/DEAH box helicase [Burkholderiales bacterium]|jgi:ATP-dependent RNA helicase RhlE|nr:DEAD/DEAH box helicase [Burkholderiales bacterium]
MHRDAAAAPATSADPASTFAALGLLPELLRAIADQGYEQPTPIQLKAIPVILQRRDVMGAAQTGTGKTAGFTLPLLQFLAPDANSSLSPARHPTRVLILTPTRELAAQVEESVRLYGKYLPLRTAVVYGGIDIDPQIKALHAGAEIIVATPGRLLDHLHQKTVNLSRVEFLVLDEADRMLDMGFMPDIKRILSVLPKQRQNLLFSATFPEEVRRLAKELLHAPVTIEVAPRNAPAELVTHQVYLVPAARKRALLTHLIRSRDMRQVLVFVRMKRDANSLAREIQRAGIATQAIHSDRTQAERMQALDEFKEGKVTALVATDIAARGLDIEQLPFVVNYELPHAAEDYVHRIGRTGRAGLPGEAISLVANDEMKFLEDIEKLLKRSIPRATATGISHDAPEGRGHGAPHGRGARTGHERTETSRPPVRGREERERHPRPARERDEHRSSRPAPAAKSTVDASGFDFSKPYEPAAAKHTDEASPAGHKPHPLRRGHHRPTAALLGGSLSRDKDKK